MRNSSLLRLAGLGLFSATFLSPIPDTEMEISAPYCLKQDLLLPVKNHILAVADFFTRETITPVCAIETPLEKRKQTDQQTLIEERKISPANPISTPFPSRDDNIQVTVIDSRKSDYDKQMVEPGHSERLSPGDTIDQILEYRPVNEEDPLIEGDVNSINKSNTTGQMLQAPRFYLDETSSQKPVTPASGNVAIITTSKETGINSYPDDLFEKRIDRLKTIATAGNFSTKYAFLINLGLRSGLKRFFIVDLSTKKILHSGLVAHGKGKEKFTLDKKYSNLNGSSCSSLGLYKIGNPYNGSFGKSFRLTGMEKSNSNAASRAIVLHAMGCIPDNETDFPICQSEGCPSVSPSFFEVLGKTISTERSPVLLWIFDPLVDEDN